MSKLGTKSYMISAVGNDMAGDFILLSPFQPWELYKLFSLNLFFLALIKHKKALYLCIDNALCYIIWNKLLVETKIPFLEVEKPPQQFMVLNLNIYQQLNLLAHCRCCLDVIWWFCYSVYWVTCRSLHVMCVLLKVYHYYNISDLHNSW